MSLCHYARVPYLGDQWRIMTSARADPRMRDQRDWHPAVPLGRRPDVVRAGNLPDEVGTGSVNGAAVGAVDGDASGEGR